MTDIQLKYWDQQETKRHNYATETETNRHNVRTEGQQDRIIGETIRHNVRTENQTDKRLAEDIRHNMVGEDIGRRNLAIQQQNADTNARNADTNRYNAQTNRNNSNSQIALNAEKQRQEHVKANQAEANEWFNTYKERFDDVWGAIDSVVDTGVDITKGFNNVVSGLSKR